MWRWTETEGRDDFLGLEIWVRPHKGVHRGGVLGVLNISTEEEKRSGLEGNTISLSPICLKRQISFNRKFLMFSREENISLVLGI